MTPALFPVNLLAYSLQIALLLALAASVPAVLRLKAPAARLAYWQLLLFGALLLPALRPWQTPIVAGRVQVVTTVKALQASQARMPVIPWSEIVLVTLAAGVLFRLAKLGAGFWRLRQYRLGSLPFLPEAPRFSPAELRISEAVSSPVTFGFRQPVILLPTSFPELAAPLRHAILCHEELHVERRDWLFTVAEELVRAILWFHPAIWWLLSEIQLAREQTVDQAVIALTNEREEYVDALLAIAGSAPRLELAPAPLFLRRRHLKQRVISILKEIRMSRTRTVSAFAAGLCLLAASCWFVTGAIPLQAAPQSAADAAGVAVANDGAQLLHRAPVSYPAAAIARGIQGTVIVQARLDGSGAVSDATVVSGPDELRNSALQSVLNWHFVKEAALTTRDVSITYTLPSAAAQTTPAQPRTIQAGRTVKSINITGLSPAASADLQSRLPVHQGDNVTTEQAEKTAAAVHEFDSHLVAASVPVSPTEDAVAISVAPPAPPSAARPGAIRVGGNHQQMNLVSQDPKPVYPPLAKAARVQGTVQFEATIGKDGHIVNLQLVNGPPLLAQAAMEAVRQWVYKPTLLNGNPVDVITTVDINFYLAP